MPANGKKTHESPWVHLEGAAQILQVSRRTMERIVADPEQRRKFGARRVMGQWRFPRKHLETLPNLK